MMNQDIYIYDLNMRQKGTISANIPYTVNVRNKPNGTIISKINQYSYISGIKYDNGWIEIGVNRWIYDSGISDFNKYPHY